MKPWAFRVLLWLPLVLIPLVTSSKTLDPALSVRFTLFSVCLLVLLVALNDYRKKGLQFIFSREQRIWLFLYIIYFGISGISLFFQSSNLADGLFQWLMIFELGVAVFLFSLLFSSNPQFFEELTRGAVILGLISGIWGLVQFFTKVLPAGLTHESAYFLTGTFANKNIFAEVLSLLLPFQLIGISRFNRIWRTMAVITLIISIFLLIAGLSRSAWVSLVIAGTTGFLVILFFFRKVFLNATSVKRILSTGILAGMVALAAMLVVDQLGPSGLLGKQLHSLTHPNYGSAKDRLLLWEKTLEMCKEDPLWGSGMGTWKIKIMKYGNTGLKSADDLTYYQRPHNDYLWILSEQGIIALISFLLGMGCVFYVVYRKIRNGSGKKRQEELITCFFVLIIYLALSFFAFPKERIEHNIILALVLSAILVREGNETGILVYNVKTISLLVGAGLLFSTYVGLTRYRSEALTRAGLEDRGNALWEASYRELGRAENCFYRIDPTSTPLAWYKGMAQYNLGNIDEAYREFSRAWEYCPYHQHVLNNLATCLVLRGDTATAIRYYRQAVGLSPHFQEAWINLASVQFNCGNLDGAYQAIHQVDSNCNKENYRPYLLVILRSWSASKLEKIGLPLLQPYVETILKDDEWLFDVHVKSLKEKRNFFQQLLLDAIWDMEQHGEKKLAKEYRKNVSLFHDEKI